MSGKLDGSKKLARVHTCRLNVKGVYEGWIPEIVQQLTGVGPILGGGTLIELTGNFRRRLAGYKSNRGRPVA